jgi:hypothetical protein
MRYTVYRIIVCSRTKIRMISSLRNLCVRILDADLFTIVIFQILDIKSNYLPGIVQVHGSLKRFDLAFWCFGNGAQKTHSLSDDEAKMGCITGTCKTRGAGLPLIQSGGSHLSLDLSSPPRYFIFYPDYGTPG